MGSEEKIYMPSEECISWRRSRTLMCSALPCMYSIVLVAAEEIKSIKNG